MDLEIRSDSNAAPPGPPSGAFGVERDTRLFPGYSCFGAMPYIFPDGCDMRYWNAPRRGVLSGYVVNVAINA